MGGGCCKPSQKSASNPKLKRNIKKSNLPEMRKKFELMKQLNIESIPVKSLGTNGPLHISGLKNVNASDCGIKSIDDDFFDASSRTLKTVNFTSNAISEFPNLFACTKLVTLKLSKNNLNKVPKEICQIKTLKHLELDHQDIEELIPELFLGNLELLSISHNKISAIPEKTRNGDDLFTSFSQTLVCLDLGHNPIGSIPNGLLEQTNIHKLNLEGTNASKKELELMPGLSQYIERRKNRIDIAIWNEIDVDWNLCGLQG
ncbi:unnamed protein product [Moneuplotes crassus]|uniref:Uncharacterized protein n=1 Tax=Euplotes crassus TaxID=5936 RepID=A0AAD2D3M0_EUPCR|nr:unnamed protein product [Moneuplotes crassus]